MENDSLSNISKNIQQETLDGDIEQIRTIGYRSIDLIVDYLKNIDNYPIVPNKSLKDMKKVFQEPLPQEEQDPLHLMNECQQKILENAIRFGHPNVLGWVLASGNPIGAFADGMASAINQNVALSGVSMATAVELCVLGWIKEMIGYSSNAGGILVSGGSMANLTGLAIARTVKADVDIQTIGMKPKKKMRIYVSKEVHMCIPKAVTLLGIGLNNICWVDVDKKYRMDINDLQRKIDIDIQKGYNPFIVIGTAGTVNTGAIDPLRSLANICRNYNIWFHVDAAYGGFAALSPQSKPLLVGIESADSVALDPHKWLFIPYEAGCILVKNPEYMTQTFATKTDYLHLDHKKGTSDENVDFFDYGLQLSRGFRALKIWMSLKQYGIKKISRIIDNNIILARYLGELLSKSNDFEMATPPNLSVVCFRYIPVDLNKQNDVKVDSTKIEKYLSVLNRSILSSLRKDGRALLSGAIINNQFYLRACIVNFRTTTRNIDDIFGILQEIGRKTDEKLRRTVL